MSNRKVTWFGGGQLYDSQTDASTGVGDVIQLIPGVTVADAAAAVRTQFVIEAIYLHFSVRRLLTTTFDALGFLVYQNGMNEASSNPTLALDALSTGDRLYQRKEILMMSPLAVPPLLGTSDLLAFTVSDEIKTEHHQFMAARKHDRAGQVLCLTLNSDVSVVTRVFVQWRVLCAWYG